MSPLRGFCRYVLSFILQSFHPFGVFMVFLLYQYQLRRSDPEKIVKHDKAV